MWDMSLVINSLGLALDVVGAFLIYKFGLPPQIDREGTVYLVTEEVDETEKQKAKQFDVRSELGIKLLIAGFLLQLVSNFLRW